MDSPSTSRLEVLNTDILDIICGMVYELKQSKEDPASLERLSRTDKYMRALTIPHLFKTLNMIFHGDRPWERGSSRMKSWDASFARFVRTCNISFAYGYQQPHGVFVPELPAQMAEIVTSLTRVNQITCSIVESKEAHFEEGFRSLKKQIQSVKSILGLSSHILVHLCPNLERISSSRRYRRTNPALSMVVNHRKLHGLEKIRYLEMNHAWSVNDIKGQKPLFLGGTLLHEAVPNVSTLVLDGYIATDIYQFLPALAEFRALKFLGIMDLPALNVGFHRPKCGIAYRELREMVSLQAKDLREAVTVAAFSACKHLQEVWIGSGSKARAERQDGAVKNIEYFFNLTCGLVAYYFFVYFARFHIIG
ncbi:hypothetical protein C8J57DRAFT_1305808 [Mycena rebaudengoi]|nr:hypothetical protein C8J57DRAFT_1305808 [Mycena rebaudengoi]